MVQTKELDCGLVKYKTKQDILSDVREYEARNKWLKKEIKQQTKMFNHLYEHIIVCMRMYKRTWKNRMI